MLTVGQGLGLEIAKNIALMGVKSLTLHDTEPVKLRDLSSNFYASEADAEQGINRAAAVRPKIQELNDRCDLKARERESSEWRVVTCCCRCTSSPSLKTSCPSSRLWC